VLKVDAAKHESCSKCASMDWDIFYESAVMGQRREIMRMECRCGHKKYAVPMDGDSKLYYDGDY